MSKAPLLLTDWVTIGTSGPTVDGRVIEPEKLEQAAKNYNPLEYCAVVNVDHGYGNLGTVWELRSRKDDKQRTCLDARIRPNQYYLMYNYADMKLFFSMELQSNFAGSNEAYLTGLAATDEPASLGTSCARFSAMKHQEDCYRSSALEGRILLSGAAPGGGLIGQIKTALSEFFNKPQNEEKDMTKEEFTEGLKTVTGPLIELTQKIDAFLTQKPEVEATGKTKNEQDGFDAAKEFKTLTGKVEELTQKLDGALKEIPAIPNKNSGAIEDEELI